MKNAVVHISQFYPCSRIEVGSELFYVCELGKYLQIRGKVLSLDGVLLDSKLKHTRFWQYFRIALHNKWIQGAGVSNSEMEITALNPLNLKGVKNIILEENEIVHNREEYNRRTSDTEFHWITPEKKRVHFAIQKPDVWAWSLNTGDASADQINIMNLRGEHASQSWVNLLAYVAVERYVGGTIETFAIQFGSEVVGGRELPLVDIFSLERNTEALQGWVHINLTMSEEEELQAGYETWWYEGFEAGYMRKQSTAEEKIEYAKEKDIQEGDIVLYYTRDKQQQNNYIKSIASMVPAIVRKMDKRGIDLELIFNKNTRFGYSEDYKKLTMAAKQMYESKESRQRLRNRLESRDWLDIGVEYALFDELEFITPMQCEDILNLQVTDGTREDNIVLPEVEAVFWLMKDYDIEFNEERFKSQYIGDKPTMYEQYMGGGNLPEFVYIDD